VEIKAIDLGGFLCVCTNLAHRDRSYSDFYAPDASRLQAAPSILCSQTQGFQFLIPSRSWQRKCGRSSSLGSADGGQCLQHARTWQQYVNPVKQGVVQRCGMEE
jgi:hypothetical protein